jgi:cell division protease FtsH
MASIQRESDAVLFTKDQLFAQLVTAMGGVASEELVFGVPSTGAEQDLEQATDLARDMIGRFGMGVRRRRLLTKEGESFLGDELAVGQISAQTHHEMENEIDELLERAEQEAHRLLELHRDVLDTMANRLEAEETLEGTDLEAVLALVRPEVTLFGGILNENPHNGEMEDSTLGTV